jgi:hypothetical protein
MSLAPSHDQAATAINSAAEAGARASLVERAIALGFALAVSVAMIGWLYLLALAVWNGASWLMS